MTVGNDLIAEHNLAAEKPKLVAQAESLLKTARTDDPNWPVFENQKQRQEWRKKR